MHVYAVAVYGIAYGADHSDYDDSDLVRDGTAGEVTQHGRNRDGTDAAVYFDTGVHSTEEGGVVVVGRFQDAGRGSALRSDACGSGSGGGLLELHIHPARNFAGGGDGDVGLGFTEHDDCSDCEVNLTSSWLVKAVRRDVWAVLSAFLVTGEFLGTGRG